MRLNRCEMWFVGSISTIKKLVQFFGMSEFLSFERKKQAKWANFTPVELLFFQKPQKLSPKTTSLISKICIELVHKSMLTHVYRTPSWFPITKRKLWTRIPSVFFKIVMNCRETHPRFYVFRLERACPL